MTDDQAPTADSIKKHVSNLGPEANAFLDDIYKTTAAMFDEARDRYGISEGGSLVLFGLMSSAAAIILSSRGDIEANWTQACATALEAAKNNFMRNAGLEQ